MSQACQNTILHPPRCWVAALNLPSSKTASLDTFFCQPSIICIFINNIFHRKTETILYTGYIWARAHFLISVYWSVCQSPRSTFCGWSPDSGWAIKVTQFRVGWNKSFSPLRSLAGLCPRANYYQWWSQLSSSSISSVSSLCSLQVFTIFPWPWWRPPGTEASMNTK